MACQTYNCYDTSFIICFAPISLKGHVYPCRGIHTRVLPIKYLIELTCINRGGLDYRGKSGSASPELNFAPQIFMFVSMIFLEKYKESFVFCEKWMFTKKMVKLSPIIMLEGGGGGKILSEVNIYPSAQCLFVCPLCLSFLRPEFRRKIPSDHPSIRRLNRPLSDEPTSVR